MAICFRSVSSIICLATDSLPFTRATATLPTPLASLALAVARHGGLYCCRRAFCGLISEWSSAVPTIPVAL